jgi:hypothetical protein
MTTMIADAPVFRMEGTLSRFTCDVEAPPLVQLTRESEDEDCTVVRRESEVGDGHADILDPAPPPPAATAPEGDDKELSKA